MYGDCGYFPYSEWINRRYCERHGYDYVIRRDRPRVDRHICWHKIPVIIEELYDCEYLLFLDADAIFYSHELTVENELIPEMQEKTILMAQDCGKESSRWNPGLPNSGVILVDVGEAAQRFFTDWNRVSEIDERTRWSWPPDQLALWHHVLPEYKDMLRVVVDYYLVQGQLGQFIRHFCICSEEHRIAAMKAVYARVARHLYY